MGSRFLTDLAVVLRAWGLVVHEHDGWQNRARGSGGYESGRPTHVMAHHTASGPGSDPNGDVAYIATGADAAPLANLYLSRTGQVWVIAAGATNTNGSGADTWGGGVPVDSMNTYAIGIEAANGGTGEPWPTAQTDAYLLMCRALCTTYSIPTHHVRGHAEWAPGRKVDPAGPPRWATGADTWRMDDYRADVELPPVTPPVPPTTTEEVMATAILHVVDCNAQFIGQGPLLADGTVHNLFITWYGPGPESSPFLADHAAAPDVIHQNVTMATIQRDLILLGNPEDIEDSAGPWGPQDFYRVVRS